MTGQIRERVIYAVTTDGHRRSYLDTLGAIFALAPVSGPMTTALFRRLVLAERLLFASLDDDMLSFGAVACARALLGRPTTALLLRAQKCFETTRWYYPAKRMAFRTLRHVPHLTIATITPFDAAPHYRHVAHTGVCDPQYWDLYDGTAMRRPGSTALSDEVRARAAGRKVVCALGALTAGKGLAFLAGTLERHPQVLDDVLVVCAGRFSPCDARLATRLSEAGALIVDRFVGDGELGSLYGIADGIWACHVPDYDQASGVFGRAVQLGVPAIVRAGSVIAAFAALNRLEHLPVAYGAHDALAALLQQLPSRNGAAAPSSDGKREALIAAWRREFVETIGAGLEKQSGDACSVC